MNKLSELIHWYRINYRIWKAFKLMPEGIQSGGFWPSETYFKYRPECTFEGRQVLNFGCGKTVYLSDNVTNLDVVSHPGVNVVCTTNKMPFADNTFDFILANHVLEHVPNWFETFKEMARVIKPGGKIEVWIPPVSSDSSFTYRDHINRIGIQSFAGCKSFNRSGNNLSAQEEFKELGNVTNLHLVDKMRRPAIKWWTMLAWPSLMAFFGDHLRNTVSEECFIFTKKP